MCYRTLPPLLILLLAACKGPGAGAPAPVREAGTRVELWVDVAGEPGGDGSRARPLRSLAEALGHPGALTVHLGPGIHEGAHALPAGVRLEGEGEGTLLRLGEGEGTVLRASGDATLVGLEVRGGAWGLEVTGGRVTLERVGFSGQRRGAVWLGAGRLDAVASRFEATVKETVGVLVEAVGTSSGDARLRDVQFVGPFRRAVRVRGLGSSAELEEASFEGVVTALGMDGGRARVRRATAERGSGAAFSTVEGRLTLEDVSVLGFEVAVSASRVEALEARGVRSSGATRAGVAVAASKGVVLEDVVVRGSGSHGAVQLTGSDVDARRLHVEDAAEYGLLAVGGRVRVRDGTFVGVRSRDGIAGEALHLRQATADVEGVVARDTAGACVLAAQGAKVTLRDVELERCGRSGLAVDTRASLRATDVELRGAGGSALSATEDGVLSVDGLSARGTREGLVQADCSGATRARLTRVRAEDVRGAEARCVEREPGARGR
ncbi:hypothetical protein LY474_16940 [Myxococcus stipitatus]|uniref:hypothetical protein n=1 Tax=Myxococcus stipitatus TaxID=83455 RepID=UPI001F295A68|nr:hypothetical protein [Myxococcus stipitatus]MCE9669497.1 hypothetical protein [Myxococcus stipitatus]